MIKIGFVHNRFIWYRIPLFKKLSKNYNIKFIFTHENNDNLNAIKEIDYVLLKNRAGFALGLFKEIITNDYDIFIIGCCSNLQELFETLVSIFIIKIMRKPAIIWSEQWRYPEKLHKKLGMPLFKLIAKKSNAYIVPGIQHRKFAIELGCNPKKIFIAPNASNFCKSDIQKEIKNIYEDKKIVLFVGRLIKLKGVDILIKSFSMLKREMNDLILLIVGDGDQKEDLIALANELKINDIQFTGWIDNIDLPFYYNNSKLLVLPSRNTDASGLVLSEAMYYGNPVIATEAVGSAYDLINNEENGFIVPAENIDSLYQAMKFILMDKKIQEKMAKKSKHIANNNNFERMFKTFKQAITYSKKQ